jgi:hypothetical protein
MARTPQLLCRILDANPTLADWEARRRREQQLTELVRRQLPRPLAERVRVAGDDGAVLELAVEVGAVAGIVRQRTPDLLAVLQASGHRFTGIRVRVQVRPAPVARQKIPRTQPDKASLAPLSGFAQRLPAGPLKAALARLLRRIG